MSAAGLIEAGGGFGAQRWILGLALVIVSACGTKPVCSGGDTRACLGPGQCAGAQFCLEAGTGFSACDCGAGTGGGQTGGGGGGAGGGGGSADGGFIVRGAAQKGPFIIGSTVSVAALDTAGVQTGQVFLSQTNNDRGEFELTVLTLPIEFAELQASGFHFNEITGALSAAELSLRSISRLDGTPTYINVLTHLASNRIRTLAASSADLTSAQTLAEQELRTSLPIGVPAGGAVPASLLNLLGGDTDANAYLFAVSVVFAQAALTSNPGAVDAELQQLLNTAALDFADGTFEPALIARLEAAERSVEVERVRAAFQRRLREIGSSSTVPDLNRVLDSDGDGIPNASDACPFQAGAVPSAQFCMQSLELLEFDEQAELVLVGGTNGTSVVIGTTDGGPGDKQVSMRWLEGDGGLGPIIWITDVDGGRLSTSAPLVTNLTLDGSGMVIVGLVNAGCATAVFASPAGVTKVVRLACDATEGPSVFQTPGGAMYALWRSNSPPFNSTWYAWSDGGTFGPPALLCTECSLVFASSVSGEVAVSMLDVGVPNGSHRLRRSDGDGGWSSASIAPFTSFPTLTLDSRGTLRALWTGLSGSPSQLNWASHDGAAWSATSQVASGSIEPWPRLAGNGAGRAIAAFGRTGQLFSTVLPTDGGGWEAPQLLATGAAYSTGALLNETQGAVSWTVPAQSSLSIARYDLATGWGASQVLPRVSGEALLSFVDSSTLRIVWRPLDGGVSTALLR